MGFYLRKSLRVGPLRFNLSKSGVGVSAGVRGFRVGSGPRGNYVHIGRKGLYYRATLPPDTRQNESRVPGASSSGPQEAPGPGNRLRDIDSDDVSRMRDSSSRDLLLEFDQKRKKMRLAPIVSAAAGGLFLLLFAASAATWSMGLMLALGALSIAAAWVRDQLAKTVVLFYELEPVSEEDYQALHDGFDALASCEQAWHIEAEGDVEDWKRSAGASSVVRRKPISLSKLAPPFVKTNIEVPAIPVGRQTLYFFPDRILVFEPNGVGAVSYGDIVVDRCQTRFIEDGSVPSDAEIVDRTWRYVNKKGGPDRRFKDNRELPIALYEDLHLTSASGLNELCQFSRAEVAREFEGALHNLARRLPA